MPPDISDIIGQFYDVAVDDAAWPVAAEGLASWFRAGSGILYLEDRSGPSLLTTPGWSETALRLYAEHYHVKDPYAEFGRTLRDAGVYLGQEIVDRRSFLETEIWQDFGRRYCEQTWHFLSASSPLQDGASLRIGLHRPAGEQEFAEADRRNMLRVLPHLRRAMQLRNRLLREAGISHARAAALDALTTGVIVLDGSDHIVLASAAAEVFSAQGDIVLSAHGQGLRLKQQKEGRQLDRLIQDVARGGSGGAMRVSRDAALPLALLISRLPEGLSPNGVHATDRHPVLVLIRDLGAGPLEIATLTRLFGLTSAEAEVMASLIAGHSAEAIADERQRSVLTVRFQIRAILAKTGAANLRDLTRMLAGLHP